MTRRLKDRMSNQSGTVLIVTAGMLVVVIGAAALAIDLGSFWKAQKQAQAAADAAALAASQDLPTNTTAASTDGTNYGRTNYPGSTVSVQTNYNSQPGEVKVTVHANTPSFFGQFFGLTKANVTASAVAGGNGTSAPAAIFAYDDQCAHPGIALDANATSITGAVISNGSLSQEANPTSTLGVGSYGGPNGCAYTDNGKGQFTSGPTENPALQAFPTDFRNNPPACTVTGTNMTWSQSNATIPAGVYCASGTITLSGNNLNGTGVTFIANSFVITGNNAVFSAPSSTGLLFYETGTSTLRFEGNHMTLATVSDPQGGIIFAPNATVQFDGNNSGTGFIEANDVVIDGNSFQINGSGPVMGGTGNSLIS